MLQVTHVKLPAHEQGCKLKHAKRGLVKGSSVPGVGRIEDPDNASFDPERSTDQAAPQPFPAPRERKEIRFPDVGYQQCGTAGENPAGNAFTTPYRSLQRSIWQKAMMGVNTHACPTFGTAIHEHHRATCRADQAGGERDLLLQAIALAIHVQSVKQGVQTKQGKGCLHVLLDKIGSKRFEHIT